MVSTDGMINWPAIAHTTGPKEKSNIHIEYRTERSVPMFLLHHLVRPFATQLVTARKEYPPGSPRLQAHNKAKLKCEVKEYMLEDIYLYELSLRKALGQNTSATATRKKRLYYFAGGGWQMPASSNHWALCADMTSDLPDTRVTLVSYPLAPSSPASVTFGPLLKLYRRLCQDAADGNEEVILAGNSAGGNIVLCVTLAALMEDQSLPAPAALMVISPSCDLSRSNPDIQLVARKDPILRVPFIESTAEQWRADWDASDPRVSPLMGNVRLLAQKDVQVHGVVGRYDILSPDVLLFREKCEEAGVHGEWLDWDKQMHVFPLAYTYKLPESVQAKNWIIQVLRGS